MSTRRAIAVMLLFCLAGCANNPSLSPPPPSSAPSSAASTEPSGGPTDPDAKTISGTVEEGVERGCRLLKDATGSYLLVFHDTAMKAEAPVGAKVTLTGKASPGMMSTCQQGVPFIVTAVRPG
jgi:hypothetical protein